MIMEREPPRRRPKLRISLVVIFAAVLVCAAAFAVYVNIYYYSTPAAVQAMASDGTVSVCEPRDGDGIPTISGEEQISQTAEAIAAFSVP